MTNKELFVLCYRAAELILARTKVKYPGCSTAQACGDPPAPTANETTQAMLQALQTNLPGLMDVIGKNIGPFESSLFKSQADISPKQAAVDQAIKASNAQSQAQTESGLLSGAGGDVVRKASALNQELDPEFFKTRAALGDSSSKLLGSLDFGDSLSGGESADIERSLNRDNIAAGTMDTPSAIQTISNALSFGRAGEARKSARQQTATNAIGSVGAINPGTRQGIDPLQTAVGRNSSPGINTSVGSSALGLGSNVLGQVGQAAGQSNEINANRRDVLDRQAQMLGSVSC